MELFADTYKRDNEAPMKYLYHSDDMNDIKETIAKMTFVCILQNEARINPDNVIQLAMATMFESANPTAAISQREHSTARLLDISSSPAVLTTCLYIDNAQNADLLRTDSGISMLASVHAQAIEQYLRLNQ